MTACYFDVVKNGEVIGEVCRVGNGCTVYVRVNDKEHQKDLFIKNRRELKNAVNFWLEEIYSLNAEK